MTIRGITLVSTATLLAAAALAPTAGAQQRRSAHPARRAQTRCANADASASAVPKPAMRDAVVCLINQQRAAHHLPALRAHRLLDNSAQRWTNAMVSSGQFTHGVNFGARITAAGFPWSAAGENIATGFQTPRQVVTAWMASPGHCVNILDPTYADVGTGVSSHRLGPYGPSTWTQDFGLSRGHAAPSRNTGPASGCPYHI
jgi:uncharacterized protein YkwD